MGEAGPSAAAFASALTLRNDADLCGSAGSAIGGAGAAGLTGAAGATGAAAAGAAAAAAGAAAAGWPAATSAGGLKSGLIGSSKPTWMWFWCAASVKNSGPAIANGLPISLGRIDGSSSARCDAISRASKFDALTGTPSIAAMSTPRPRWWLDTEPPVVNFGWSDSVAEIVSLWSWLSLVRTDTIRGSIRPPLRSVMPAESNTTFLLSSSATVSGDGGPPVPSAPNWAGSIAPDPDDGAAAATSGAAAAAGAACGSGAAGAGAARLGGRRRGLGRGRRGRVASSARRRVRLVQRNRA